MAAKYWYPPPESISPYAGGPQPTDYAPPQAYPPTGANSPPPAGYADVEAGGGAGKPPPIRVLYVLYVEWETGSVAELQAHRASASSQTRAATHTNAAAY
ncbi:unnamed protein product [Closterium sp. NIES-54]